jgi:hypothetical protein
MSGRIGGDLRTQIAEAMALIRGVSAIEHDASETG